MNKGSVRIIAVLLSVFMLVSWTTAIAEETWICPGCGKECRGNICGNCGTAKPVWFCPLCMTENAGRFCTNCGYVNPEIRSNTEPPNIPTTVIPPATTTPVGNIAQGQTSNFNIRGGVQFGMKMAEVKQIEASNGNGPYLQAEVVDGPKGYHQDSLIYGDINIDEYPNSTLLYSFDRTAKKLVRIQYSLSSKYYLPVANIKKIYNDVVAKMGKKYGSFFTDTDKNKYIHSDDKFGVSFHLESNMIQREEKVYWTQFSLRGGIEFGMSMDQVKQVEKLNGSFLANEVINGGKWFHHDTLRYEKLVLEGYPESWINYAFDLNSKKLVIIEYVLLPKEDLTAKEGSIHWPLSIEFCIARLINGWYGIQ